MPFGADDEVQVTTPSLLRRYAIPDVLGGEVILGGAFKRSGELAKLVREGLPVKSLYLLAERLDLRPDQMSTLMSLLGDRLADEL